MRIRPATLAWAIFVVACAIHYGFHSPWLDDYDGVQLAFGMEKLDLTVHQPHPPGYAAYIYLARAVDLVLGDRQASLSLLSTLGGSASVALTFLLGARLVSIPAGVLAAAILVMIPLHFQQSIVAMTDVVVIPFFLGTLLCLRTAYARPDTWGTRGVVAAGLLMGWGVGVRPQWVFLFAAAGLVYVLAARHLARTAILIGSGVLATLAWIVPISVGHGGFWPYVTLAQDQYTSHPTDRANFDVEAILRLSEWMVHRWETSVAILAGMATLSALAFTRWLRSPATDGRHAAMSRPVLVTLVLSWFLIAAATSLLFHPLRLPRSAVPLLPPLVLLLAATIWPGIASIPRPTLRLAAVAPVFVALGLMATTSASQGAALRTTVPAPVQGTQFIQREFDPATTLLVGQRNHRHWKYYAPEFTWRTPFTPTLFRITGAFGPHKRVVTDYPLVSLVPTRTVRHTRSADVYFDFPEVTLYQYDNERIMLSIVDGMYSMEKTGFWTSGQMIGELRSLGQAENQLALRLRSTFQEPAPTSVWIDGNEAWSGMVDTTQQTVVLPLPVGLDWVPFELVTPDGCQPQLAADGSSGRCLSLFVTDMRIMPARYDLEATVGFQRGGSGHVFLRGAASDPEDWGTWMLGAGAALEFTLEERPERDLYMSVDGFWYVEPGQPPLEVTVGVNGELVEERTVRLSDRDHPTFRIPAELVGDDGRVRLEFTFANPASPADNGESDTRVLGLAIRSLRIAEE